MTRTLIKKKALIRWILIFSLFAANSYAAYYDPNAVRKNSAGQLDNWLHYYRGLEQIEAKWWDQALNEFNYYFRHEDLHRHMFGIAYFGLGQMYQAMGRPEQAIENYEIAIREDKHPDVKITDKALMFIASIHFKRKNYQDAIKVYQKALDANPDSGLIHYYLGLSYLKIGKIDEADKENQEAIKRGIKYTALQEGINDALKGKNKNLNGKITNK